MVTHSRPGMQRNAINHLHKQTAPTSHWLHGRETRLLHVKLMFLIKHGMNQTEICLKKNTQMSLNSNYCHKLQNKTQQHEEGHTSFKPRCVAPYVTPVQQLPPTSGVDLRGLQSAGEDAGHHACGRQRRLIKRSQRQEKKRHSAALL